MELNSKALNLLQVARLLMSPEFCITNSPIRASAIAEGLEQDYSIESILDAMSKRTDKEVDKLSKGLTSQLVKPNPDYQGVEAWAYRKGLIAAAKTIGCFFGEVSEEYIKSNKVKSLLDELLLELDKDFPVFTPEDGANENVVSDMPLQEGIKVGTGFTSDGKQDKGRALKIFEATMFAFNALSEHERGKYSFQYFLCLATSLEDGCTAKEAHHEAGCLVAQFEAKENEAKLAKLSEMKTE